MADFSKSADIQITHRRKRNIKNEKKYDKKNIKKI